jgi:predicted transcriptional regulator
MRSKCVQKQDMSELKVVRGMVRIGAKPNVARVLLFLARTPETTSAAIERETGVRRTNLTAVMKELRSREWVACRTVPPSHQGRPEKLYELAKPLPEILREIQRMTECQVIRQLARLKKLSVIKERDYSRS